MRPQNLDQLLLEKAEDSNGHDSKGDNSADEGAEGGERSQSGGVLMQDDDDEDTDANDVELEFNLAQLTQFIKKQGYPISSSFVSYYSADFQAQVNCGPEPISNAIPISYQDLE